MKKQLLLVFLFLNIFYSQSQKIVYELDGNWIKYNSEMKDGSKLFDRFNDDSTYIEFKFKNKTLCINSNPLHTINQSCFPYTLENNGYVLEYC